MLRLSRKSSWWAALGVILAIPEALAHSQGLTAGPPSGAPEAGVRMVAEGSITLDGRLDEPGWAHAPAIDLIQQDPHPGAPTPFRTEIRLLADGKHLYLGVTCVDPDPGRLSLHSLARDSDQTHDDHLTIVLDPFDSQRLGYVFQVNAGGDRTDGLISPASSLPNYDWDGIWNAKVRRTADGWVAEIEIDTQSLQFPHGVDRWRMNVQRYVPREQLSLQWAGITLDANIFDLSRTGHAHRGRDLAAGARPGRPALCAAASGQPSWQHRGTGGRRFAIQRHPEPCRHPDGQSGFCRGRSGYPAGQPDALFAVLP
ncbi:carbohydrate binding family 9 domain-containing protein [Rhodanobacter sp. 115]|uniref:carbohydrate binding family 9 domain-containing protein n=1 Tax=Rhodanobacter sp. FW021-MT20 TaxID=1162282 RepID=UPI000260DF24|nr:carbohydrate binding family 9 domain-containing protein [Rhodanobacter sp. 115]EIL96207.1 hypothetical protein UU5_07748 [Rhodanobacter sp. 115]